MTTSARDVERDGGNLEYLHWSYKRYLDSAIREVYDYTGTPIKFSFRASSHKGRRAR